MRTLALGDIHGCITALETMAEYVGFSTEDHLITLGDYVDRGPDSKGVIDFLLKLKETHQLTALRGNHEVAMQKAMIDRHSGQALGVFRAGACAVSRDGESYFCAREFRPQASAG